MKEQTTKYYYEWTTGNHGQILEADLQENFAKGLMIESQITFYKSEEDLNRVVNRLRDMFKVVQKHYRGKDNGKNSRRTKGIL
tara:strand:+ start:354 stop:602 length:249 start_codon:yes stop_codon:yes gene_type:complete